MKPSVTINSPMADSPIPTTSSDGRSAARDSGTRCRTATNPIVATGTLSRNTQPHQMWPSIQPPRIGPIGRARKFAADQTPTAFGRSSSSNRTVRADSAMTMIPAPATPSSARAAMNDPGVVDAAQPIEPSAKSTSETSITRRRPSRSPSSPAGRTDVASTSRYPEENHCRSASPACRRPASVGSATLSTVPSRPTASTAKLTAPSAHQRDAEPLAASPDEVDVAIN